MTTTTDRPTHTQHRVWATESGSALNDGVPMTTLEAVAFIRKCRPSANVVVDGWTLTYVWGGGCRSRYVGQPPMPSDVHAAISELESTLAVRPMTSAQASLLVAALRAAQDGTDPVPALLAMLSLPVS